MKNRTVLAPLKNQNSHLKFSRLAKKRLKNPLRKIAKFHPNAETGLNMSQRACIDLLDQRNAQQAAPARAQAMSVVRRKGEWKPPSYSTTLAHRIKRKRAVKKAAARYSDLFLVCKHREVFTSKLGTINSAKGDNFGSKHVNFKRIYVDIILNGATTEFQLDSGADASIISKNVLDAMCPSWQSLPDAGKIKLNSASNTPINIISTKWLNVSLTTDLHESKAHKFVIVKHNNQTLLGADFIFAYHLGLFWKKSCNTPFLTLPSRYADQRKRLIPTTTRSRNAMGRNMCVTSFAPQQTQVLEFKIDRLSNADSCSVLPCFNHASNDESARDLIILPSHSHIQSKNLVTAMVMNASHTTVQLKEGGMKCLVQLDVGAVNIISGKDLLDEPKIIASLEKEMTRNPYFQFPVSNLSPSIKALYASLEEKPLALSGVGLEAQLLSAEQQEIGGEKIKGDIKARGYSGINPTQEERERVIERLYPLPEDKSKFEREIGEDLGIENLPKLQPLEQYDITQVEPQYRCFVRKLLHDHDKAMSTHQFDIGDTSKTLGYLTLPLIRELPRCNNKVYTMQGGKREVLRSILIMMLKSKMIERSSTDKLACPVFIISKKDLNATPRFLVDSTEINQYFASPHQLLPQISAMLNEVGAVRPRLLSSVDISSAYHSIKLCKRTSKHVHLSTQFGTYKALVAVQGLSALPGIFSQYIYRALHSDHLDNMSPDPIHNCHCFLDDCIGATGESNVDLGMHVDTLREIQKFEHPEDVKDPQHTPLNEGERKIALSHYFLMSSILTRLEHHGFKVAPKKLNFYQKSTKILGHILDWKGLTVDPSRIQKMAEAPMPMNRTQMQRFCGYLSSIKYFTPPELAEQHALQAPLTSVNADYIIEDKHKKAFKEAKRLLTAAPFFLSFPDYHACKVIFTDASDVLLSGILLDVHLPSIEIEITDQSAVIDIYQTDYLYRTENNFLRLHNLYVIVSECKSGSSFFESLCLLTQMAGISNIPVNHKFLRANTLHLIENSSLKQEFSPTFRRRGLPWSQFFDRYYVANSGIDADNFLIAAAARYIDREIVIVSRERPDKFDDTDGKLYFQKYSASTTARGKPIIWLLKIVKQNETYYLPLFQYKANKFCQYSSLDKVKFDLAYMERADIIALIKDYMTHPGKSKQPLKTNVIGYYSQSIDKTLQGASIWLKECAALVNTLYKFKSLIELSPVVVSFTDSSVVYLLCSKAIKDTCLKIKRTAVLLNLEYSNVLIAGLPGNDNISDYLSRIVDLPQVVSKSVLAKNIRISDCSELAGTPMSLEEGEQVVSSMAPKHSFLAPTKVKKEKQADQADEILGTIQLAVDDNAGLDYSQKEISKLTIGEKLLLDTLKPIRILAERLSIFEIQQKQQELPILDEMRIRSGKPNSEGVRYEPKHDLLMHGDRIFIPPSLEGVVLSYCHLTTGHVGQRKLYLVVGRKYYFPDMEEKCKILVAACHACALNNPLRKRKALAGSVPIASHPFECISLDFLEVVKNAAGIKAILVISDHFSKAIMTYFLQSTAAAPVLEKLREYLMYTGLSTRYVLCDNGAPFSGQEFNKFLYLTGIYKINSTPYLSRARGLVESMNRVITVMLKKLLLLSPRFNFKDILFLAPVFYNSGVHHGTKLAPYTIMYGSDPLALGPLGGRIREPPKLFAETVREELRELREAIADRVTATVETLRTVQEKYLTKANKFRKATPIFKQGQICFIKDYASTLATGEKRKFKSNLIKSPFLVVSSSKNSVTLMRLADSFVTARHPNDIVVYKRELKGSPMLQDLGPEVWKILGEPLDEKNLAELAKKDELPLIYTDRIVEMPSRPTTRSLSKKRKALENVYFEEDPNYYDLDSQEEAEEASQQERKRVTFDLPGFEQT